MLFVVDGSAIRRSHREGHHASHRRVVACCAAPDLAAGSIGRARGSVSARPIATPCVTVQEAEMRDAWPIADVHCDVFYGGDLFTTFLRWDRVLSLHVGAKLAEVRKARFTCFVAAERRAAGQPSQPQSGTDGAPVLDQLSHAVLRTLLTAIKMPEALETWGVRFDARGICGAVCFDNLGEHLPAERVKVNGDWTWRKRTNIAYLSNLCVAKMAQRQGIGKQLLRRCEQEALALGNVALALHVEPDNAAAVGLYRAMGYSIIRRGDGSGWEPLVGRSAADGHLLMLKALQSPVTSQSGPRGA